jgi:hypothetical protein
MQSMPHITQKFLTLGKVGLLAGLVAMTATGCEDGPTKTQQRKVGGAQTSDGAQIDLIDPKDDVMGSDAPGGARASGGGAAAGKSGAGATRSADAAKPSANSRTGRWSVILATFSTADHAAKANAFRSQLVSEYPELREATVRRVGKGSAIVIGRFDAPEDKGAQGELKRVKAIERNGKKPFAGVMLMRTSSDAASGPPKAHDLRSLRAQFPNVRPLFTLQVAAWSTFSEKGVEYDGMRESAERYCAELRKKGHEAWFLHDEDAETSIVAVGHFDRRAYDPKSTLFSPEVQELMREFPANLVNGEPLLIPVDPRKPEGKTKPQPCRLVEVPGL